MGFFLFPAEFHFGRAADWYCVSITELQKSCSVAVSKFSLLEFFKKALCWPVSCLICLEAAVQDRTWTFWACEAQHSSLNPRFPILSHFRNGWQSSVSDRNISCTHHALFTRNSLRHRASASQFFICSESSCLQIAQFPTKCIHVLGKWAFIAFLHAFYLNLYIFVYFWNATMKTCQH